MSVTEVGAQPVTLPELNMVAPSNAKPRSVTVVVGSALGTEVRVDAPKKAPFKLVKLVQFVTPVKYCDPVQLVCVLP